MSERPALILGLDTSTTVGVGLARDGVPVATAVVEDRRAHVEQLIPLVRQVCEEAGAAVSEVSELVAGLGPGPFTGLRVGVVTASVLAVALAAPWRGVCS